MKIVCTIVSTVVFTAATSFAANLASDNAADSAYGGGVINGQNGGFGFSNWVEVAENGPGGSGSFIGNSSNNSGGGSGNINTGGNSWGMYANTNGNVSGNTELLYRDFTGGSLAVGQTLQLSMDNGYVDGGSVVGFVLRTGNVYTNKNTGQRLEFLFVGGGANYSAFGSSFDDTGVGYTGDGLDLAFTLTGIDSYSLSISNHGTSIVTIHNGTLGGTAGAGIDSIALYNQNAGLGSNNDLFFNSLAIVPEPSTYLLVLAGLAGLLGFRRR